MVIKNKALGIDIALESNSNLLVATGDIQTTVTNDLSTVDDLEVVRQALVKRLNTTKGGLWAHPEYGCDIWDILSDPMTDTWFKQAIAAVIECINDDPRAQVISVTYDAVPQERQVVFTIVYSVVDGRQNNLIWNYASEAVTDSV